METQPPVRAEDLQKQIRAVERRDSFASILYFIATLLLAAAVVATYAPYVTMTLEAYRLSGRNLQHAQFALIGLILALNLYALGKRRALRKARTAVVDELLRRDTVEKLTLVDSVTGAYSRRYMDEIIPRETNRADRRETALSFVKIAIDDFDGATSRLGPEAGERVVKEVAALLKRVFRPADVVIRYSNDEFIVVMAETTKHGALIAVGRLLGKEDEWNRKTPISGYEMSLSCGVADYHKGGSITDVLAAADHRVTLYRDQQSPLT